VYLSAYTYRATVWFDFVVPGPEEREWLAEKYPESWPKYAPLWQNIENRWAQSDPGVDFSVHGSAIVTFCDMCQIVLCEGDPSYNTACTHTHGDKKYIFCSEPCRWVFTQEPQRYEQHKDVVKRVLGGEAPANVLELITKYFNLTYQDWGKDAFRGEYAWLKRETRC
jgi:toluene monooxygenase system protein A